MKEEMEDNSIFFQCKVLDVNDPMMLGRIRGVLVTDNPDDILNGVQDPPWNPKKDPWTQRDPLVFNPLIPYYIYATPKVNELVQVMFLNKDFKYQNQYYVQNTFYSPTSIFNQFNFGANKYTGTGMQIKDPLPLKNQDGTYPKTINQGVFPEPGDNGLIGRGSADVIVKENEVLLRAGKMKGAQLQPDVLPVNNPQRSFLQLSRFQVIKQNLPDRTFIQLQETVVLVKYLIEWTISNPENTQDKFTGAVYLYQLKPDATVNSKNLTVNSPVSDNLKSLFALKNFTMLSKEDTIKFINNFIEECNDGKNRLDSNQRFPIFYRPSPLMFSKINLSIPTGTNANPIEVKNIFEIYRQIKLLKGEKGGSGLIYAKNRVGKPTVPKKKKVPDSKYKNLPNTVAAMGGDRLYMLSHNSQIPGKGKINFDNSIYGITPEQFADIESKTSSTVRGEELLELINMIVRFLVTHTHAYPGLPPVPVTQDGSTVDKILIELQNAVNKILNTYIRVN